jgi:hypothetical protein
MLIENAIQGYFKTSTTIFAKKQKQTTYLEYNSTINCSLMFSGI